MVWKKLLDGKVCHLLVVHKTINIQYINFSKFQTEVKKRFKIGNVIVAELAQDNALTLSASMDIGLSTCMVCEFFITGTMGRRL